MIDAWLYPPVNKIIDEFLIKTFIFSEFPMFS